MKQMNLETFCNLLNSQPDATIVINDGHNTLKVKHANCEYHDNCISICNKHLSFKYRIDDDLSEVDFETIFGVAFYGLKYHNKHGDIPTWNSDEYSYMEIKIDSPAYKHKAIEKMQKKQEEERKIVWRKLGVC